MHTGECSSLLASSHTQTHTHSHSYSHNNAYTHAFIIVVLLLIVSIYLCSNAELGSLPGECSSSHGDESEPPSPSSSLVSFLFLFFFFSFSFDFFFFSVDLLCCDGDDIDRGCLVSVESGAMYLSVAVGCSKKREKNQLATKHVRSINYTPLYLC